MLPLRLKALLESPAYDPDLSWDELVELVALLVEEVLPDALHEGAVAFLDLNLPGAKVAELIEWPGQWLGNRWFEEATFLPEELAHHALERSGRELRGGEGL